MNNRKKQKNNLSKQLFFFDFKKTIKILKM